MNSDDHAIRQDLKLLNDNNNKSFLLLTKSIIDMQTQKLFNLLNVSPEQSSATIFNTPISVLELDKFYIISQMYKQHNIFNEIKKYINKTTKIKKLSPLLNNLFESADETKNMKNFLNAIILVNIIKKNLKNKVKDDIKNYDLYNKLNKIEPTLMSSKLHLDLIHTYDTKEQMQEFLESYTYETIDMNYFLTINDEDYDNIYNELFLFK
jgi:hypothetical protein